MHSLPPTPFFADYHMDEIDNGYLPDEPIIYYKPVLARPRPRPRYNRISYPPDSLLTEREIHRRSGYYVFNPLAGKSVFVNAFSL